MLIKCQYNNFSTAGKDALAKEIISTIYPMVETRWLYLMKHLEKSFSIMVKALRDNIDKAKAQMEKYESELKSVEKLLTSLGTSHNNSLAVHIAEDRMLEAEARSNQSKIAYLDINMKNSLELASMGVSK